MLLYSKTTKVPRVTHCLVARKSCGCPISVRRFESPMQALIWTEAREADGLVVSKKTINFAKKLIKNGLGCSCSHKNRPV
jgi:hypothetical protein